MTTTNVPFSDDGTAVLTREVENSEENLLSDYLAMLRQEERNDLRSPFDCKTSNEQRSVSFYDFYEVSRCIKEVLIRKSTKVALQFPDFMLSDSPRVVSLLQKEYRMTKSSQTIIPTSENEESNDMLQRDVLFFVLGDTSYSNCCVDEVAAAHLSADLIIHYGPACMSPINYIPTIYVFGKAPLSQSHLLWNIGICLEKFYEQKESLLDVPVTIETDKTKESEAYEDNQLNISHADTIENVILLYDLCYYHVIKDMENDFQNLISTVNNKVSLKSKRKKENFKMKLNIGQLPSEKSDMFEIVTRQMDKVELNSDSTSKMKEDNTGHFSKNTEDKNFNCILGGLQIDKDFLELSGSQLINTTVLYIGNNKTNQLSTLLLRLHPAKFLIYDPMIPIDAYSDLETNHELDNHCFSKCYWLNNDELTAWTSTRQTSYSFGNLMKNPKKEGKVITVTTNEMFITPNIPEQSRDVSRTLKRRYYLIQKAKDAEVIGLVIGALGASRYSHLIKNLRSMIESKGKKAYIFSIGRINVAKLANFGAVDVFCFLSCPEGALVIQKDDREYMTPVITPLELEYALGENDTTYLGLGGDRLYSLDYRDLESMKHFDESNQKRSISHSLDARFNENEDEVENNTINGENHEDDVDKPYYSLITGQFKASKEIQDKDVIQLSYEKPSEDGKHLITTTSSRELSTFSSAAAKYLHSLEFQGLVLREDKTNPDEALDTENDEDNAQESKNSHINGAKIESGTIGIASRYSSI